MIINHLSQIQENSIIFLAEGLSEAGFIEKVLQNFGENNNALVYCFKGLANLKTVLKSIAGIPGFDRLKALGIMLDAETDCNARTDSIISLFANHNISISKDNLLNANAFSIGKCQTGIFISPGRGLPGRIEDLVMKEIQESELFTCLTQYTSCINQKLSSPADEKAIVQTYISAISGSLSGIGRAFQADVLKVDHPSYDIPRKLFQNIITKSSNS